MIREEVKLTVLNTVSNVARDHSGFRHHSASSAAHGVRAGLLAASLLPNSSSGPERLPQRRDRPATERRSFHRQTCQRLHREASYQSHGETGGVDPNADSQQVGLLKVVYQPDDWRPGDDQEIKWNEIFGEWKPKPRHVWRLVMKNLKIGIIAEQVGISELAVQNTLQKIFEEVGVNSRLELVLWSLDHEPSQASSAGNPAA
jgi:DNA-binding CsgD family transcriptional regulator